MSKLQVLFVTLIALLSAIWGTSCINKKTYTSPHGYDFNKPEKYKMPESLTEISGIAFHHGKSDSIYAEQDEDGRIFYFKPGDKEVKYSTFGKSGDYEDIAIMGDQVVMLRSDGTFFVFPFNAVRGEEVADVQKVEGQLNKGEYEGLYADEKTKRLYALCKHCSDEKTSKSCGVFSFTVAADGTVKQNGQYSIDVKEIEDLAKQNKINFRPSALAKNQLTNEWYVLSSVNKMLIITNADWKIKAVYSLNPALFIQPEGMAFDSQNNLYISNEGDEVTSGNILKFTYKK